MKMQFHILAMMGIITIESTFCDSARLKSVTTAVAQTHLNFQSDNNNNC